MWCPGPGATDGAVAAAAAVVVDVQHLFSSTFIFWIGALGSVRGASSVRVALGWRMSMPLRLDLAAETTPLNHHLFIVCLLLLLSVNLLLVWSILHLEIPHSLMCVLIVSILYPDLYGWVFANTYLLDEEMFNTHNNVQPIPTLHTSSESETRSLSLALTMTMTIMTTLATHIWPACADVSTGFCDGLTRRPNRLAHSIRRGEAAFEAFDAWSSPIFLPFCHLLYLTRLVLWKVSEDCKDIFQTLLLLFCLDL